MLIDDVIKHGSYSRFCESWVSEANDSLETAIENALLLLNIAKFLVLDLDGVVSLTNRHMISVEVSGELARAERDFSGLISSLH